MRVFNTLDGPLILDEDGHTIGGREHADVPDTEHVRAHVRAGRLIEVPAQTKPASTPKAKPAPAATTEEA